MSVITQNGSLLTLINVFTVVPEKQQAVVDLLVRATEQDVKILAGFISANIHKSDDGLRVVNYAQWENKEAFENFLRNPRANAHFKQAEEIAEKIDFHTYTVEHVFAK